MTKVNKRATKQQLNPQIQKVEKFVDYSSLLENHNSVDFIEFYQNFMIKDKKINNSKRSKHEPSKMHLNGSINNVNNRDCNDSRLLKLLKDEGLIMKQVKKSKVQFRR